VRSRVPRAGLTEARVIDEGEKMADEVGLTQLTLAALATRLGVRQPSLYKHIDGMAGLQRGIAVRAKNELAEILSRAAVGRSRGDAVMSIAKAYRTWAVEHPGRYGAAQRAPVPGDVDDEAASRAVVEIVSDVMAGFELHEDEAIDAIRAIRAALHGFVTLETGGAFGLPVDINRSFDRLVGGLVTALSNWNATANNEGGLG
jgi:AcrR family transcriptional regulator